MNDNFACFVERNFLRTSPLVHKFLNHKLSFLDKNAAKHGCNKYLLHLFLTERACCCGYSGQERFSLCNHCNKREIRQTSDCRTGRKKRVSSKTCVCVSQYLVNVANTVLDNTSSHPPPTMGSSSSSLLCPQLWSAVSNTLNQWRDDLTGLQVDYFTSHENVTNTNFVVI